MWTRWKSWPSTAHLLWRRFASASERQRQTYTWLHQQTNSGQRGRLLQREKHAFEQCFERLRLDDAWPVQQVARVLQASHRDGLAWCPGHCRREHGPECRLHGQLDVRRRSFAVAEEHVVRISLGRIAGTTWAHPPGFPCRRTFCRPRVASPSLRASRGSPFVQLEAHCAQHLDPIGHPVCCRQRHALAIHWLCAVVHYGHDSPPLVVSLSRADRCRFEMMDLEDRLKNNMCSHLLSGLARALRWLGRVSFLVFGRRT